MKSHKSCKICQSELRGQIDHLLANGTSLMQTAAWAADHGLSITKKNVWTHNKKHRLDIPINQKDIKAPDPKCVKVTEETKRLAKEFLENSQLLTPGDTLRLIIQKATVDILEGNLKPTVNDANKAAELLQKMKDGDPMQEALIKALREIGMSDKVVVSQ